jgi:3'-5' exoribonuclease
MPLGARFRVRRPFHGSSRNGTGFLTCELADGSLCIRAYAWEGECTGFHVPRHGDRIYAAGRVRWRAQRFELVCRELRVEDSAARVRWARERLADMVPALEPQVLQGFLPRVFHDRGIGPRFLTAPASLRHHHAYSGGLLVHSVESAWSVFRWMDTHPLRGLATTAALLHDVGKVRTLAVDMTRTPLGQIVDHADLTLEVLAAHLQWLDGHWPEGATLLRHLLTARPRQDHPSPAYGALELVRAADRISAMEIPPTPPRDRHASPG